jgi:vanillate O-demethylase ferredoxin subunit
MVRTLEAQGAPWKLLYCARNRQRAAFYEDLCALNRNRCHFHFDDEHPGSLLDVAAHLSDVGPDTHIYCCGPAPLMDAVKFSTGHRPEGHVHFEWFTPAMTATASSSDSPFIVVLRRSGARYSVPAGRSILEVLEDNAEGVPFSCREGLCATCRTTVLEGIPDHRDSVLSDTERSANDQMLICVSRAKTPVLELDL